MALARIAATLLGASSGAAPPQRPTGVNAEKLAIEKSMGTDAYWHDQKAQDRYLQILEAEAHGVALPDSGIDFAVIRDNVSNLGEAGNTWIGELDRAGRTDETLARASEAAQNLLTDLGDPAIADGFDGLANEIQIAVFRELAADPPQHVPLVDDEKLKEFAEAEGSLLLPEWGNDARAKLTTALSRWHRALEPLSEADVYELHEFVSERLSMEERASILRTLAA